jgi:hypothetical protein
VSIDVWHNCRGLLDAARAAPERKCLRRHGPATSTSVNDLRPTHSARRACGLQTIRCGLPASLGATDRESTPLDGIGAEQLPAISSGGCSAGTRSTYALSALPRLEERVWYKRGVREDEVGR